MAGAERPVGSMQAALAACRRHLVAGGVFSALLNMLYIAPTLYMLQVYDRVVPTHGHLTLLFLTIVLMASLLVIAVLDRVRMRLLVRASVVLDVTLAPAILDAAIHRPDAPASRQALRDFDAMRQTLTGPGVLALFDAPWTPVYILICFLVHPAIGAVALFGGLLLPCIAWRNEVATGTKMKHAQQAAVATYAAQDALLSSAEAVRALGMRRSTVARQVRQREVARDLSTSAGFTSGFYLAATKFVRLALQSLALGLGALLAIDGQISPGAIFASSFLIARALAPIEQLVAAWKGLVQARNSYTSLSALVGHGTPIEPTVLPAPRGAIAAEGLTAVLPGHERPLVDNVSFALAPGEVLAILGPSGGGKSTLLRLLATAMPADRGAIRFDGAASTDWDQERLTRALGFLPQNTALLAGRVRDNIARFSGELEADREDIDRAVVAAAQSIGAHDLIVRLPGGYDYELGAGGVGLSAGQAQRVALARAVFGDPAILLLDEPNAHLDVDGDALLVAALARLKAQGKTIVIVSHKLSVLPAVDKILVMRDGRVALFGPRDEVMNALKPAPTVTAAPQRRTVAL
ncbi:type I secretion system permease/ATPase [Sphingomonas sp. Leaf339]|uniref:type I secretion system permease/ATPase n=1 Tax=Sphingomonas sp. Leaf339 TaxID=1736343 RepID=UPI000ACB8CD1|nr:type I secretion system permease/ATPase [Sphingomonas sp. Leaf339]